MYCELPPLKWDMHKISIKLRYLPIKPMHLMFNQLLPDQRIMLQVAKQLRYCEPTVLMFEMRVWIHLIQWLLLPCDSELSGLHSRWGLLPMFRWVLRQHCREMHSCPTQLQQGEHQRYLSVMRAWICVGQWSLLQGSQQLLCLQPFQ